MDSASSTLKPLFTALVEKWRSAGHRSFSMLATYYRKAAKQQDHWESESSLVEQIDLFAYVEEIEKLASETIKPVRPAPTVSKPEVPDMSPPVISNPHWLSPYGLWIIVHNLFGIACWVNVYTVTRRFGGREAGGWYYLSYTCEKSRQVGFWEAQAIRLHWFREYKISHKWGDLLTRSGGQDIIVCIEPRRAARTTKRAPQFSEYGNRAIPYSLVQQGSIG